MHYVNIIYLCTGFFLNWLSLPAEIPGILVIHVIIVAFNDKIKPHSIISAKASYSRLELYNFGDFTQETPRFDTLS